MNKKILPTIMFCLTIGFFAKPFTANALIIYADKSTPTINVGDTVVVNILVDTEGKEINAIEGTLKIKGSADISSVNTGGSIFSLWPEKPTISNNQEISFTGGLDSGVYGNSLRFFNLSITPKIAGDIIFEPTGIIGYLNDGKGTALKSSIKSFKIKAIKQSDTTTSTTKNDNSLLLQEDKTLPLPFNIELSHDEFLFGGKYFITFYTTDEMSGINRYEVKEGDLPYSISENNYVLKDQNLKSVIYVKAIDNAGNERVEILGTPEIKKTYDTFKITEIIVTIIMSFGLFYFLLKFFKKNK